MRRAGAARARARGGRHGQHEPRRRHPVRRGTGCAARRVLFIQGANPAATAPDQPTMLRGLSRGGRLHGRARAGDDRHRPLRRRRPPATTHFEADDVADSYGSFVVQPCPGRDRPCGREPHERRGGGRAGCTAGPRRRGVRSRPGPGAGRSDRGRGGGVEVLRQPGRRCSSSTPSSFPIGGAGRDVPDGELPGAPVPAAGQPRSAHAHQPGDGPTINSMFAEFARRRPSVDPSGRCGAVDWVDTNCRSGTTRPRSSCPAARRVAAPACAMPKGLLAPGSVPAASRRTASRWDDLRLAGCVLQRRKGRRRSSCESETAR